MGWPFSATVYVHRYLIVCMATRFEIPSAKDLADIVKGLHSQLRTLINDGKCVDEVWREHLKDKEVLQVYSQAMHQLATGPWAGKDAERICWCEQACEDYRSYRLEQLLSKDLRRISHEMPTHVPTSLLPPTPCDVKELVKELNSRAWQLLDVGSCYNPFLASPQFDVTAIDIAPATKSVLECDFLSVNIVSKSDQLIHCQREQCVDCQPKIPTAHETAKAARPIHIPPYLYGDYYDVVVFSLLLSYLPCTTQRLTCCINAHRVLQLHGLLLVVSPDSSHQNKHAALMVKWKQCIEAIGFHRWKYEKMTHLHCMAFRKTQMTRIDYSDVMSQHALLEIPQDKR